MIKFVVPSVQSHTAVSIGDRMPAGHASRIDLVTLADLARARELPASTYVFGGLERTSDDGRALAREVWSQLAEAGGLRLLNNPYRFLSRHDLLLRLHDADVNRHRAYRITDLAAAHPRYPVFFRRDSEHGGNLTELLDGKEEVDKALRGLLRCSFDPNDLILVEFCDTSDADGIYRKYSACRVGPTVFAAQLDYSDHWAVKRYPRRLPVSPDDPLTQRLVDEEHVYVTDNPHAQAIAGVFDLAELEYGRVDYSLLDGKPCIWEINSAPFYGRPPSVKRTPMQRQLGEMRWPAKEMANRLFAAALQAIDSPVESRNIPIEIDAALRALVLMAEEEGVRRRRQARRVRALGKLVPRLRILEPLRGTVAGILTRKGRAKP